MRIFGTLLVPAALWRTRSTVLQSSTTADNESTLRSVTFCNLPKNEQPDLLADFLLEIGACSTSLTDADKDTDMEQAIFMEPSNDSWLDSIHWAAPLWNRCNLTAHFPASVSLSSVLDLVRDTFPDQQLLSDIAQEAVPNRDWVIHVQQSWPPIVVADKFCLKFPWHTDLQPEPHWIVLELQGGIAFGTGEHPTTQLCLEWLHDVISNEETAVTTVLDYGSGSGVLGMAACAMSDKITATGIDLDVDACLIANANARVNQLPMRNYLPPLLDTSDAESQSLVLKAHQHARSNCESSELLLQQELGTFDVTVANILATPLVTLAPVLAQLTSRYIGLSGILPHQSDMVVEAYQQAGFEVTTVRELNGWMLVAGAK